MVRFFVFKSQIGVPFATLKSHTSRRIRTFWLCARQDRRELVRLFVTALQSIFWSTCC